MQWASGDEAREREACYLLLENYAPVSEMAPTSDLAITGSIPACMNGEFLRVGPNPQFEPVRGYHWFDGDGMIHGLKIKDGKATYVARYVRTSRLEQEEFFGAPKFVKVGDMKGMLGYFIVAVGVLRKMLGVLDSSNGEGVGNTALVFHNKKLLALDERDRPYSVKVLENGDLETVGIEDYGQRLNHPFTAHPKIDPVTGEMFIFSYNLVSPQLIYRVLSKDGAVGVPVPIPIPRPIIMHDFAISENYAIFMDLPLSLDIWGLAKGDFIIKFDPKKESRLGIFPRYATDGSQIRWFTIPTCYIFHTVNAWEEDDEVILTACIKDSIDLNPVQEIQGKKAWSVDRSRLYEFRMNLKTGEVKQRQLSILRVDFPRIHPEYTGRKVRYTYCAVLDEQDKTIGLVKYDLSMEPTLSRELKAGGNIAGVFHYGPGRVGGDPIFVPRNPGTVGVPEDDGYLISFVHDVNTDTSEVVIIDAKTMELDPVAVVRLPRRVPHGFHALFVSEEQLKQQAA